MNENISTSEIEEKLEWNTPTLEVLNADKTESGFGGFDEDADTKSGS